MNLDKPTAEIIDKYLKALHNWNEPNLQYKIYKEQIEPTTDLGTLPKLMQMVYNYQTKNDLYLIAVDGDTSNKMQDLDWFINVAGGFVSIWEEQEREREQKDKVDKVNDSVLTTNTTVK